jgi:hypothetical protein
MKKINIISGIILSTILCVSNYVTAQAPEKMSYQAVIRNSSDALVSNQSIGMRISLLQGSTSGTAVYVETQNPTSNTNGLVSIEIGGGTSFSGSFSAIDWANGPFFIKTETDPTGGTNYTITGTSQLLSVPYALHAKTAGSVNETDPIFAASVASGISSNDTTNWNNDLIFDGDTTHWKANNGDIGFVLGNVGIGTYNPSEKLQIIGNILLNGPNYNTDTCSLMLFEDAASGISLDYLGPQNRLDFTGSVLGTKTSLLTLQRTGNFGIGTTAPARVLHVKDVMRLEPRTSSPSTPSKGDIYFDSTLNKLRVWDGTIWQNCW